MDNTDRQREVCSLFFLFVVRSTMEPVSLDSILAKTLRESGADSEKDALVLSLHACLLSAGFLCVAIGEKVTHCLGAVKPWLFIKILIQLAKLVKGVH